MSVVLLDEARARLRPATARSRRATARPAPTWPRLSVDLAAFAALLGLAWLLMKWT